MLARCQKYRLGLNDAMAGYFNMPALRPLISAVTAAPAIPALPDPGPAPAEPHRARGARDLGQKRAILRMKSFDLV